MTVQSLLLSLALRVDPLDEDGQDFTLATIGVKNGERFSKQRLLDIYNEARKIFAEAIMLQWPRVRRTMSVFGTINTANVTFANGQATIPDGYTLGLMLVDQNNREIEIAAAEQKPLLKEFDAVDNPIVYEEGTVLRSENGSAFVPDGQYKLTYYGIQDFTLADVTGGTTKETFNESLQPHILDAAVALAQGQARTTVLGIAQGRAA